MLQDETTRNVSKGELQVKALCVAANDAAENTSDWSAQNKLGREKADVLIETMQKTRSPSRLGHYVKEMIKAGVFGPTEVGFFHRISEYLIAG
jgi:hypothetical protein